jgi:K+-transporting ATPase KdpF subunit
MDGGDVFAGNARHVAVLRLSRCLRKNLRPFPMIVLTAIVTAFLFVYLFVALIRPEWF